MLTPFLRVARRAASMFRGQSTLVIVDGGIRLRAAVWCNGVNGTARERDEFLAKREAPVWRQRLQRAYNRRRRGRQALAALQSLQHELEDRNQSAAAVWRKA